MLKAVSRNGEKCGKFTFFFSKFFYLSKKSSGYKVHYFLKSRNVGNNFNKKKQQHTIMKQAVIYLIIILCFSCSFIEKKDSKTNSKISLNNSRKIDIQDTLVYLKKLSLVGDFDGDGKLDTIYQNVINEKTKQQIDYFPSKQWDSIENYFNKIGADVILTLKKHKCDTLHLGSGGGLYCLINIGDNNHDKKEEIALVTDYYNFTNISPCEIYTICDNKWIKLKSFKIHESAFDYEGEKIPEFKQIRGFLENRKNKWFYIDYEDLFNAEADKDTILKPLKIKKSC